MRAAEDDADDILDALQGKYGGLGIDIDEMWEAARAEDAEIERRRDAL